MGEIMTVGDLIKQLKGFDKTRKVILSKDSEGNDFSPLDECSTGMYVPESTWNGTVGLEKLTDTLKSQGYTEEDIGKDGEHKRKLLIEDKDGNIIAHIMLHSDNNLAKL